MQSYSPDLSNSGSSIFQCPAAKPKKSPGPRGPYHPPVPYQAPCPPPLPPKDDFCKPPYSAPLHPEFGPFTRNSRDECPPPVSACTGKCNTPKSEGKVPLRVQLPDFLIARHEFVERCRDVTVDHGVSLRDLRRKKLYMGDPQDLLQLMREYLFYKKLCGWIKGEMEFKRNELLEKAKELICSMDKRCLETNVLPIEEFTCPQPAPMSCGVVNCSLATKHNEDDCKVLLAKGRRKLAKQRRKLQRRYEREQRKRERQQEKERAQYERQLEKLQRDQERDQRRDLERAKKIAEYAKKLKENQQKKLEAENLSCRPQKEMGTPKLKADPKTRSALEEILEFACCTQD